MSENYDIMVSVVMTAYNHGPYIAQALDSVFMQKTNFSFEVIVGEDCSPVPDRSREILLEYKKIYGDRLILILHEKNVGPRQNGLSISKKVRGKYQAWLECDDYWTDPYKLQKQVDILENHPEYGGCGADHCLVDDNGNSLIDKNLGLRKDCLYTMRDYKKKGYTVHNNTLMRRVDLLNYDDMEKLMGPFPTMGDIFNFSIIYANGPLYVFKDVMLAHRSGSSVSTSFSYQQTKKMIYYSYMQMDISKALDKYFDYKYDFSFIIVNRIAEVLVAYFFAKKDVCIEKSELKKFIRSNVFSVRIRSFGAFLRRIFTRGAKKIQRQFFDI